MGGQPRAPSPNWGCIRSNLPDLLTEQLGMVDRDWNFSLFSLSLSLYFWLYVFLELKSILKI